MNLAIITLKSDGRPFGISNNMYAQNQFTETVRTHFDTIVIIESDIKLLSETKYAIEIEIINANKLQTIVSKKNPVISLMLKDKCYIAKGNHILNSSVPDSCDIFYLANKEGKVLMGNNNKLSFIKVPQ